MCLVATILYSADTEYFHYFRKFCWTLLRARTSHADPQVLNKCSGINEYIRKFKKKVERLMSGKCGLFLQSAGGYLCLFSHPTVLSSSHKSSGLAAPEVALLRNMPQYWDWLGARSPYQSMSLDLLLFSLNREIWSNFKSLQKTQILDYFRFLKFIHIMYRCKLDENLKLHIRTLYYSHLQLYFLKYCLVSFPCWLCMCVWWGCKQQLCHMK